MICWFLAKLFSIFIYTNICKGQQQDNYYTFLIYPFQ